MTDLADELLHGPRGRRLCLDAAASTDDELSQAVFWLGHRLDPSPGTLIRFTADGSDPEPAEDPTFTEADVAGLVRRVDSGILTAESAREALRTTVDAARYWQEPDGTDAVAALPSVRDALRPVAERLVALLPDLTAPWASAQWTVDWRPASDGTAITHPSSDLLSAWTREHHDDEKRAERERPHDVHAHFSGHWWSVPYQFPTSRGRIADALELVEDSLGWEVATVIPVRGTGRILEIRSADDWAALCREFPLEATASRRHDWFRITGRDGRWLIPDWERIAERWDAVHLTTLGYLSAATRCIDVDDEYATVIAGWAPDSTVWLGDVVREWHEPRQQWRREPHENTWVAEG
ncbi:hypothetical protein [Microbacterium sp. 1.5R]|uniref:hypothetical protein n=1 Tax=Microbacterium sp. 1.5R TaxID=1916917 RepID=UPI0021B45D35|nr:hypothetical protein [Microbacterium sp. 1.5R]